MNLLCLIFGHDTLEHRMSGRGLVRGKRICLRCDRAHTLLYSWKERKNMWVDGDFYPHGNPRQVYIFANSVHKYQETVDQLKPSMPDVDHWIWVIEPGQFEDIAQEIAPQIHLADDWYESDLIQDYRFKILLATGHL